MFSTFKKIFYEFQNFRVKLASANADHISALTKVRVAARGREGEGEGEALSFVPVVDITLCAN